METGKAIIYKGHNYSSVRQMAAAEPDVLWYSRQVVRNHSHHIESPYQMVARNFDGMTFLSYPGATLIPAKKTFDMAVAIAGIADTLKMGKYGTFVEIGTGTGVVPVTLAKLIGDYFGQIIATDISGSALEVANINSQVNYVDPSRIKWMKTDGMMGVTDWSGPVDIIFSNPPFSRSSKVHSVNKSGLHSDVALNGGEDGADYYRQFLFQARKALKRNGVLIFQNPLDKQVLHNAMYTVCYHARELPVHFLKDALNRYKDPWPQFTIVGDNLDFVYSFTDYGYDVLDSFNLEIE